MKLAITFGFLLFGLSALAAPGPVYERQSDSTSAELLLLNLNDGPSFTEWGRDHSNHMHGLMEAAYGFLNMLAEVLAERVYAGMKQRDLPMLSMIEAALRERADGTGDEPVEFERGGELTFNVTDWNITEPLYATFYTVPYARSLSSFKIDDRRKEDYNTTVVPIASNGSVTVPSDLGDVGFVLISTNATLANPASIQKRVSDDTVAATLFMYVLEEFLYALSGLGAGLQ